MIVAAGYAMLAFAAMQSAATGLPSHWLWLVAFITVMTTGELFILPTGLALFGRLGPGALGSFWTRLGAAQFFTMIALVAAFAGLLLRLVDIPAHRVLDPRGANP